MCRLACKLILVLCHDEAHLSNQCIMWLIVCGIFTQTRTASASLRQSTTLPMAGSINISAPQPVYYWFISNQALVVYLVELNETFLHYFDAKKVVFCRNNNDHGDHTYQGTLISTKNELIQLLPNFGCRCPIPSLTRNCSKLRKIHSGQGHTSLRNDCSSEFKLVKPFVFLSFIFESTDR